MKHHTKNKGDLGVLKAKVDLYEKGWMILNPETEHAPFDIVIYKNNIFKRVQIKYRKANKYGTLEVRFRSSWADKNGTHMKTVDKTTVDLYCVYCPDTDRCYYFDPKKFNKSINLRVKEPYRKQKNIKMADKYIEIL